MQIQIGQSFADYEILSILGHGGMAIVYKARDIQTGGLVALKVMYQHFMADENVLKRFEREAMVISELQHPNIIALTNYGRFEDLAYLAMQYMEGKSLADSFQKPRGILIKHTLRLLHQIASALDYAHAKGIIHRDLKLQNILLDGEKNAFLADFGIARIVDATRLTRTGNVAGTPLYMSPEQARGQVVDYRSDIYSLGVMAYLMITGYFPFTADDMLAVLHKHVAEFPSEPSTINPKLPQEVDSVLLRVLMKDPEDRYDRAVDFVDALENALLSTDAENTRIIVDIHAMNPKQSSTQYQEASRSEVIQAGLVKDKLQAEQASSRKNSRAIMIGALLLFSVIGAGLLVLMLQNNSSDSSSLMIASPPSEPETEASPSSSSIQGSGHRAKAITVIESPLYAQPDGDSEIVFDLFAGDSLEILGRSLSTDWIEVSIPGIVEGWAWWEDIKVNIDILDAPITWFDDHYDYVYLLDEDYFVATINSPASLYFEPNYDCDYEPNRLLQGDEVDVLEITDDKKWLFVYVFDSDQDGWIEIDKVDIPFDLKLVPQVTYDWGCD